ncbi:sensor domain-containing protein, partial [Mycobacterium avium subsp. paratuberculosis]
MSQKANGRWLPLLGAVVLLAAACSR